MSHFLLKLAGFMLYSLAIANAFADCKSAASSQPVYSVYVFPQFDPVIMYRNWTPFLGELEKKTGLCFDLQISEDFPAFENILKSGKPDFAYMNPYHQVVVSASPGYRPLVREQKLGLEGILVVRKDSPIRNIKELEGASITFAAPHAFAASLIMRAHLIQEGVRFTPKYLGSHSNVYRSVVRKD